MEQRREVFFAVRNLLNMMRRMAESGMGQDGPMTPMQGRVIGFIKHHPAQNVYQRDLECEFQIRRSTATAILQTMEKNGLIRREPVPQDARLKKLVLTERAIAFSDRFMLEMARAEAVVTQGVTREELDMFFHAVAKFQNNLNQYVVTTGEPACCDWGRKKNDQTPDPKHTRV